MRSGTDRYLFGEPNPVGQAQQLLNMVEQFIQLLCGGEPLCHYYTDIWLIGQACKSSHYIRNYRSRKSTDTEKSFLYLLGHLREKNQRAKIRTNVARNIISKNSAQLGQNFQNQLPNNLARSLKQTSDQLGRKCKS